MVVAVFFLLFIAITLIPVVVVLAVLNSKQQKELNQLRSQLQMLQRNENMERNKPIGPKQMPLPQNSIQQQLVSPMARDTNQGMTNMPGLNQRQNPPQSIPPSFHGQLSPQMVQKEPIPKQPAWNQPAWNQPLQGQVRPSSPTGEVQRTEMGKGYENKMEQNGVMPSNRPPSRPPVQVSAREIKQGLGIVNLTLILGVLFILISGLIFATSTWEFIPDLLKMVLILSLSGLFFFAAFLAERLFQLKHTGIAFYLLGCLFVPVVFLSIGYFQLLGQWFSLEGDGRYFFCFLASISFLGSILLGYVHYRLSFFKWAAWWVSLWVIGYFVRIFTDSQAFIWMVINGYVLGIMTWKYIKGKYLWTAYVHPIIFCLVLASGFEAVLPDLADKGLVWAVFLAAAFLGYCLVKLPQERSLRTYVSDYFLPFVMLIRGIFSLLSGNYGWSLGIFLLTAGCLFMITVEKEKKETVCLNAWLTCMMVVLSLFPLWNYCANIGGWVYQSGSISYFAAISFTGILCYYKRNVLPGFAVLQLPANLLWGITGVIQMISCYALGIPHWILFWWILTFCWIVQRRKELYYVLSIIGLLLLPALTVYSVKYDFPAVLYWLFTGITGCFFYLFYLWKIKQDNQNEWKNQMIRWVGVSGFYISVLISLMLYFGESYPAVYGVLLMLFIIVGNWIGFREKNTVLALVFNLSIRSLVVFTLGKVVPITFSQELWVNLFICIGMMCAGQLLYRRLYDIKPPREHVTGHYYIDSFSFLAGLIPFTMLIGAGNNWRFWGLILLIVCLMNGYQRSEPFMDQWITTAATAIGYVAFRLEPYVVIPKEWVTEYCLLLILIAGLILGFIWKKHGKAAEFIRFGIAVYAVLRQGFDCLSLTRISDVLVLGIAMVLVLRLAYYWRRKRWLLLSASALAVLAVYCSRSLWMNIAWWIYLLLAGIILILIAGFYEYSRKSGADIRKKINGKFREWSW